MLPFPWMPGAVSPFAPHLHATVSAAYNPTNDVLWEYKTDWTRSASSDMRIFSPDVRI